MTEPADVDPIESLNDEIRCGHSLRWVVRHGPDPESALAAAWAACVDPTELAQLTYRWYGTGIVYDFDMRIKSMSVRLRGVKWRIDIDGCSLSARAAAGLVRALVGRPPTLGELLTARPPWSR